MTTTNPHKTGAGELPLRPVSRKPRWECKRCRQVGAIVGRGLCGPCWHQAKKLGEFHAGRWPKVVRGGVRPAAPAETPRRPAAAGLTVTLHLPAEGAEVWQALLAEARRQWRTPELQLCAVLAEAQGVTP